MCFDHSFLDMTAEFEWKNVIYIFLWTYHCVYAVCQTIVAHSKSWKGFSMGENVNVSKHTFLHFDFFVENLHVFSFQGE